MNILFCDLDGTLRQPADDSKFINSLNNQRVIDGVFEAINRYKDYKIIGITNQGGVEAGFKSLDDCIQEQLYTMHLIDRLSCVYFCPDSGNTCYLVERTGLNIKYNDFTDFRKPGSGMIRLACSHISHFNNILMVGDRQEDFDCAADAKIHFQWAHIWRGDK